MVSKAIPEVFYEKTDLKHFAKFTEKHLTRSKKMRVSGLQLKTLAQLFFSEFWENFKKTFYVKHHLVTVSECLRKTF